jgi:hypothetical protein
MMPGEATVQHASKSTKQGRLPLRAIEDKSGLTDNV